MFILGGINALDGMRINGNTKKALKYLNYAYDHIPDDEQREYLEDRKRMDHLYKYYYILMSFFLLYIILFIYNKNETIYKRNKRKFRR